MKFYLTTTFLALLFTASLAWAGYFWSGGWSNWNSSDKADVVMWWSHKDSADSSIYEKWRFCWRRKSNTNKGKNPCDYNTEIVFDTEAEVTVNWDTVFKYQVEAFNKKKDKWQTKSSTISRPCFNARWSNAGTSMRCKP